jgi:hypothetical protein
LHGAILTNATDIIINGRYWQGWAVGLNGATQVSTYKHDDTLRYTENRNSAVALLGFGGVNEGVGFWTLGGFTKSATYAEGTHGTPPVASSPIHESTFESDQRLNWVEYAVFVPALKQLAVTFYGKLTATSLWTTRPSIGIYDPSKGWQAAGETLNASAAMASNPDWQTLTCQYTPLYDRELRVRMQGKGGNTGGTGTEQLYWFHDVTIGDATGIVAPVIGIQVVG